MKTTKTHWIVLGISLAIVISSLFFMENKFFFFIIGTGIIIGISPFIITIINEKRKENEKEEMFIEFSRSLVESVKTGTPISKSITNAKNKNYGALSPHINKLANQIELGIPLNTALQIFAKDINNKTITRALTLIGQAERAGGDIGEILESVAEAVVMSDKLKKERIAAISTLVTQGYIIFFIFIIIVLIMQHKIIPLLEGMTDISSGDTGGLGGSITSGTGAKLDKDTIGAAFLYLLIVQGFFSGLAIGKLSEGDVKSGFKHSFALMLISFLIYTGVNIILG